MKKVYTSLFVLILCCTQAMTQTTWDNFEDARFGTYFFATGQLIPYAENIDPSGVNTSRVAANYARNPSELFDNISIDMAIADLADYVSGSKSISMDVYSPAPGLTVQITIEDNALALPANFPVGRHSIYLATTTATNAWETLTFAFDQQPDPSVGNTDANRLVLLFEPNTNNATQWYFDNLEGPEFASDPCDGVTPSSTVFADFECNQNLDFTFSHAGVNFRRIENPDASGANTSDYVATYTRNSGEEFDVIIGRTDGDQTVPAGAMIQLDVWEDAGAPTEIRVSLQLNPDDGNPATDLLGVSDSASTSQTWETLDFDFSSIAGQTYNQVVILFEPGVFTSGLYYWDNLQFSGPVNIEENLQGVSDFAAFPNPTTGAATFEYNLETTADVQLQLFSTTGALVNTLFNGTQPAGFQRNTYDLSQLPNGLYYYALIVNGKQASGKLNIVK